MAGRPEAFAEVVTRRGENLKAIFDELSDVVIGNQRAERLVALGHLELNDGARELGYPHLFDWAAPIKDVRGRSDKKAPAREVAEALA